MKIDEWINNYNEYVEFNKRSREVFHNLMDDLPKLENIADVNISCPGHLITLSSKDKISIVFHTGALSINDAVKLAHWILDNFEEENTNV